MSTMEIAQDQQINYKRILRGKINLTFILLLVIFLPLTVFQFLSHEILLNGLIVQAIFTMVVMFVGTGFYTQIDQGINWVIIRNAALAYFSIAILVGAFAILVGTFLNYVLIDESLIGLQILMISSCFILGALKTIDVISKSKRLKTIAAILIIVVSLVLSAYSYFFL